MRESKTSYEQFSEDLAGCLELGCAPGVVIFGIIFGTIGNVIVNYALFGTWCLYHVVCL